MVRVGRDHVIALYLPLLCSPFLSLLKGASCHCGGSLAFPGHRTGAPSPRKALSYMRLYSWEGHVWGFTYPRLGNPGALSWGTTCRQTKVPSVLWSFFIQTLEGTALTLPMLSETIHFSCHFGLLVGKEHLKTDCSICISNSCRTCIMG